MQLYLASQSPRRAELLEQVGLPYHRLTIHVDERRRAGEPAWSYVDRLAREKAIAGLSEIPSTPAVVLGADTIVVVDGDILGKPSSRNDALTQLARLSGRSHEVLTAVAVVTCAPAAGRAPSGEPARRALARTSRSRVWFRMLRHAERLAYWDTGEPTDKAGSYAIQGRAAQFVTRLEGSYSGVMGLPLFETTELLRRAGVILPGNLGGEVSN